MYISVRGNHGRGDIQNSGTTVSRQNVTDTTTTPQEGTATFSIPKNLTVKKTIPIGDVIADPMASTVAQPTKTPSSNSAPAQNQQNKPVEEPKQEKVVEQIDNQNINKEEKEEKETIEPAPQKVLTEEEIALAAKKEYEELENENDNDTDDLYAKEEFLDEEDTKAVKEYNSIAQEPNSSQNQIQQAEEEQDPFTIQWNTMLDTVFAKIRTILYPLKNHPPTIKDHIVYVKVKGAIQQEHFNSQKRQVLAYWRNNIDEQIEDIVVETDETLEAPKMIYDNNDKMNHFKEENPEFTEFLNLLNLKMKD